MLRRLSDMNDASDACIVCQLNIDQSDNQHADRNVDPLTILQ